MQVQVFMDNGISVVRWSLTAFCLCSQTSNTTLFLVAGYSRYSCPYVWVRSNHRRLMKMSGAGDGEKDNPLRLKSTTRWKDGGNCCVLSRLLQGSFRSGKTGKVMEN